MLKVYPGTVDAYRNTMLPYVREFVTVEFDEFAKFVAAFRTILVCAWVCGKDVP